MHGSPDNGFHYLSGNESFATYDFVAHRRDQGNNRYANLLKQAFPQAMWALDGNKSDESWGNVMECLLGIMGASLRGKLYICHPRRTSSVEIEMKEVQEEVGEGVRRLTEMVTQFRLLGTPVTPSSQTFGPPKKQTERENTAAAAWTERRSSNWFAEKRDEREKKQADKDREFNDDIAWKKQQLVRREEHRDQAAQIARDIQDDVSQLNNGVVRLTREALFIELTMEDVSPEGTRQTHMEVEGHINKELESVRTVVGNILSKVEAIGTHTRSAAKLHYEVEKFVARKRKGGTL
jgi:signal transduction histidine kinase